MNGLKNKLQLAVNAELITQEQSQQLLLFLQKENDEEVPRFQFSHLMYYFGGFLAISATTLFITQGWEQLRGIPLFIISIILFSLGIALTNHFLKKNLTIPAGILSVFSLAMVPLAVYNVEICLGFIRPDYKDFYGNSRWYYVPMEIVTLAVGGILLYFYRFPFLLFPISSMLWFLSMDLYSLISNVTYFTQGTFTMYFGLVFVLMTICADFSLNDNGQDYVYWLYIFGVEIFWFGTCSQFNISTGELSKFFFFFINFAMTLTSVLLDRRVFAVFGVIGILNYLGYLSYRVFYHSLAFPFVLVFLGILIIFAATKWVGVEKKIIMYLRPYMPKKILKRKYHAE